ncbi:unnamed protein product [Rotaria sordida]|uniref:Uncharacterized protein n=1 Tax=Rotaria sordida TaxID=392033 RepID=A0A819XIN4_9BILA|nr:unnamed protein product [Rotaria sordida]CAF4141510.1 unnamed protein product [Rotaria sordida]
MNLELLLNEILLDLFDYFDGIDLLHAFYDLNLRFNFLLYNESRMYRFTFCSMLKRDFHMICQQHLLVITDRVIRLSLSEHEGTPKQINLFDSYLLSFSKFIQLRSFSINDARSYKILVKITDECHHLCNLVHLNFYNCSLEDNQADFQLIVKSIWSFSKLVHYNFNIDIKGKNIVNETFFDQLIPSYIRLPNIEYLWIKLPTNEQLWSIVPSLNRLYLLTVVSYIDTFQSQLKALLNRAPRLR